MTNKIVEFIALVALVYYPPIPIVLAAVHSSLPVWRRLGTKSYYFFVAFFLILDLLSLALVLQYKENILSLRLYDSRIALLGLFPIAAGFLAGRAAVGTLSWRTLFGVPEITAEPAAKLVTAGIYRYIRHPRYLEFALEVLGVAILSGLAANFFLFVYFFPAIFLAAYLEEKELIARFGQDYLAYKQRTGWFLPKI
jgi:protein-S-isoprenylcysteine O-methyltransferase Ste14